MLHIYYLFIYLFYYLYFFKETADLMHSKRLDKNKTKTKHEQVIFESMR